MKGWEFEDNGKGAYKVFDRGAMHHAEFIASVRRADLAKADLDLRSKAPGKKSKKGKCKTCKPAPTNEVPIPTETAEPEIIGQEQPTTATATYPPVLQAIEAGGEIHAERLPFPETTQPAIIGQEPRTISPAPLRLHFCLMRLSTPQSSQLGI